MTDAILFACVCVAICAAYFTGRAHLWARTRHLLDMAKMESRQSEEIANGWKENHACLSESHRASVTMLEALVYVQDQTISQLKRDVFKLHRRAQRAESATAAARREAVGQRKRADWWRSEAKRLGWTKGGEG